MKYYNQKDLPAIILTINELHHDILDNYQVANTTMHEREEQNWRSIIHETNFENKTILEMGVGTWFLPKIFIKNKVSFGKYICTDISQKMIDITKRSVDEMSTDNSFDFIKTSGDFSEFPDSSVDIIIMNSVLHHLPDIDQFYLHAARILTPEWIMIIGHEPNAYFFRHPFLFAIFIATQKLISQIGKLKNLLLWISCNSEMVDTINGELMKRGLIEKSLPENELMSMVDYHGTGGIDYRKIPTDLFTLIKVSTTDYLGTLNYAYHFRPYQFFVRAYDALMSTFFPNLGYNYCAIYKKSDKKTSL